MFLYVSFLYFHFFVVHSPHFVCRAVHYYPISTVFIHCLIFCFTMRSLFFFSFRIFSLFLLSVEVSASELEIFVLIDGSPSFGQNSTFQKIITHSVQELGSTFLNNQFLNNQFLKNQSHIVKIGVVWGSHNSTVETNLPRFVVEPTNSTEKIISGLQQFFLNSDFGSPVPEGRRKGMQGIYTAVSFISHHIARWKGFRFLVFLSDSEVTEAEWRLVSRMMYGVRPKSRTCVESYRLIFPNPRNEDPTLLDFAGTFGFTDSEALWSRMKEDFSRCIAAPSTVSHQTSTETPPSTSSAQTPTSTLGTLTPTGKTRKNLMDLGALSSHHWSNENTTSSRSKDGLITSLRWETENMTSTPSEVEPSTRTDAATSPQIPKENFTASDSKIESHWTAENRTSNSLNRMIGNVTTPYWISDDIILVENATMPGWGKDNMTTLNLMMEKVTVDWGTQNLTSFHPTMETEAPFHGLLQNVTSSERRMENVTSSERRMENVTVPERRMENVTSSERRMENVTVPERRMENVTSSEWRMENVTSSERRMENVTSSERRMENVTVPERRMENVTSSERRMENVTVSQRRMENVTVPERRMENVTLPERRMENLTLPERRMENVTASERRMENVTASERRMDNVTIAHFWKENLASVYWTPENVTASHWTRENVMPLHWTLENMTSGIEHKPIPRRRTENVQSSDSRTTNIILKTTEPVYSYNVRVVVNAPTKSGRSTSSDEKFGLDGDIDDLRATSTDASVPTSPSLVPVAHGKSSNTTVLVVYIGIAVAVLLACVILAVVVLLMLKNRKKKSMTVTKTTKRPESSETAPDHSSQPVNSQPPKIREKHGDKDPMVPVLSVEPKSYSASEEENFVDEKKFEPEASTQSAPSSHSVLAEDNAQGKGVVDGSVDVGDATYTQTSDNSLYHTPVRVP